MKVYYTRAKPPSPVGRVQRVTGARCDAKAMICSFYALRRDVGDDATTLARGYDGWSGGGARGRNTMEVALHVITRREIRFRKIAEKASFALDGWVGVGVGGWEPVLESTTLFLDTGVVPL